jgi:hypothetical protein
MRNFEFRMSLMGFRRYLSRSGNKHGGLGSYLIGQGLLGQNAEIPGKLSVACSANKHFLALRQRGE